MTTVNWIIHGGQTGVDRGAWAAAQALGLKGLVIKAGGIMPKDFTDEKGIIPESVRSHMRPCEYPSLGMRTKENVLLASALLVVVPDRLNPERTPGTALTLKYAASRPGLQVMVASRGDHDAVAHWLLHLPPSVAKQSSARTGFYLMVAGPRESKWPDGELITTDLLIRALEPKR
jgi:hypothetical protein